MRYLFILFSLFSITAQAQTFADAEAMLRGTGQGQDRYLRDSGVNVTSEWLGDLAGASLDFSGGQFNISLTGNESAFSSWDKDNSDDFKRNDLISDDPTDVNLLGGNYFAVNQPSVPDIRFSFLRSTYNTNYGFDIGVAGQGDKSLYFREISRTGSTITDAFKKVHDTSNGGIGSGFDTDLVRGSIGYTVATPQPYSVNGPWTVSGPDVSKNTGKLGVGTNSPTEKLHVVGDYFLNGKQTVRYATGISTNGGTLLDVFYSDPHRINVLGTDRSTSNWVLGYAVEPTGAASGQYKSTVDITAFQKGSLEVGKELKFKTAPAATVAIGDLVPLTTRFEITNTGEVIIGDLSGVGTRMVTTSATGLIEAQPMPNDADQWSTFPATSNVDLGSNYISPSGSSEGVRFTGGTFEVDVSSATSQRWTNGSNSAIFYLDPSAGFQLKSSGRGVSATSTAAALESGLGAVEIDNASHLFLLPASTDANVVGEIARRGDFFQVRTSTGLDSIAMRSDLLQVEESTAIPSTTKVFQLDVDQLTVDLTGVTGTKTVSLPTPLNAWVGAEKTILRIDNNSAAVLNIVTGTGADVNDSAVIMLSTNDFYVCRTDGLEVICK